MKQTFQFLALAILLYGCSLRSEDGAETGYYSIQIEPGHLPNFFAPQDGYGPLVSAHRGGRNYEKLPENSMELFRHTISKCPAILEMDISMTRDSILVLMHDATLERTSTGMGLLEEKSWKELQKLFLKDDFGNTTNYRIPLVEEVLLWGKDKAILSLDVKKGVPFEMVVDLIEQTKTTDCVFIITYNPADASKVFRLNPDLMISASMRNQEEYARMMDTGIPANKLLAFTGTILSEQKYYKLLADRQIPAILGTMGNLDRRASSRGPQVYLELINKGISILATDAPIEAWKAIQPDDVSKQGKGYSVSFKVDEQ